MTETRTAPSPDLATLRDLLVVTGREPRALVSEIKNLREAHMGEGALCFELLRLELRFLARQAGRLEESPDLAEFVERAERAALVHEQGLLEEAPQEEPAVLFDLAELAAGMRAHGMDEKAAAVRELVWQRAGKITIDQDLIEEARERYAALATEEEDLDLQQKIELLTETHRLMRRLGQAPKGRPLQRMARRLGAAASDRILGARVERILTRRGAGLFEGLSFVLLVLLLALLVVEGTFSLSGDTRHTLLLVDAGICVWFILEFCFKLALAPKRGSWFLRHMLTDLLPALPAAAVFLSVPALPVVNEAIWIRALRLLRITYFARYVNALRPVLRLFRLMLFLVRGMDSLVRRFSPILNRNFVFFEASQNAPAAIEGARERQVLFAALRREHVLIADLLPQARRAVLERRASALEAALTGLPTNLPTSTQPAAAPRIGGRDMPVERAIETLYGMTPDQLPLWLPRRDVLALDRVVKVLNAPLIRSLPFVRGLCSKDLSDSSEGRVVDLGRRVAHQLERWRDRALFLADLHGILTGPQILDRIATAMVRASKRPAVRLLLFGGLFLVVRLVVGADSAFGLALKHFVATPLLVIGGFCLVVLFLGRWLKQLAGEATESLERTSEANFIGLLELLKQREEKESLAFVARRVFRLEMPVSLATSSLEARVQRLRGILDDPLPDAPTVLREDMDRVALMFLHFLDGAILHQNDVKTTEQLLANLSLENIRQAHLRYTPKDQRRLRRLSLAEGSIFKGPYLWFHFITESVALETAKHIIDYNQHALSLRRRADATEKERRAFAAWLARRRGEVSGRTLGRSVSPAGATTFRTTEFNALDFLTVSPEREEHLGRLFGTEVLELMRADRARMIREIFGTRRLDEEPRSRRTINIHGFYQRRLSNGRVLLLPLFWLAVTLRLVSRGTKKTAAIVKEILAPDRATQALRGGRAPFAVALRKIHRMKAPGLLEAMRMRAAFDPAYCGAPPCWSEGKGHEAVPEIERDMDFLGMAEREREELRRIAASSRRRVEELHELMRGEEPLGESTCEIERRLAERAVTIAYVTDRQGLRTLLRVEHWFAQAVLHAEAKRSAPPAPLRACGRWLGRGFSRHPVDRWLDRFFADRKVSRRGRRSFRRVYAAPASEVRQIVDTCLARCEGSAPRECGLELARRIYHAHEEVSRELSALRAVQSLSVLDVRNYSRLVFGLGDYAADGEDPALAQALP